MSRIKRCFPQLKALLDIKKGGPKREFEVSLYKDKETYQKSTGSTAKYGYFDLRLNKVYTYKLANDSSYANSFNALLHEELKRASSEL